MMDIVFLLPEGQESGQFCIYRSAWPFPPSYPTTLSVSYARNHLVQCSDLHGVKHNSGSLCVLISLSKWKVKYLKAGQLWVVPKHPCWLFVFLDCNKGALARRPLHSCSYPQITKIHNKNKTEARLKVILPKQDPFLLETVQTNELPSQVSINHCWWLQCKFSLIFNSYHIV